MTYPFAGFGAFLFQREEWPIFGTDSGWNREPSIDQSRPLGSARDSIVTLAIGSAIRSFECWLSPARYVVLAALINTTAVFTDWDRPMPNTGSAFLKNVSQIGWGAVDCRNGNTQKRIRVRVELIGQG